MYLRFDTRRAPANDVKLAAMTDRLPTIRPRLLAVLGLAVLAAVAVTTAGAASVGLIGRKAPDFALPAVVGSNVRLSEYRGQAVIVSFWSSRCSVCAGQLTLLSGPEAGRSVLLPVGSTLLGRAEDAGLRVDAESRAQAARATR